MKDRNREEHVCYQGRYGHLVLYRVCGEGDCLAHARRVRRGTYHAVSLWSFGEDETTGLIGS